MKSLYRYCTLMSLVCWLPILNLRRIYVRKSSSLAPGFSRSSTVSPFKTGVVENGPVLAFGKLSLNWRVWHGTFSTRKYLYRFVVQPHSVGDVWGVFGCFVHTPVFCFASSKFSRILIEMFGNDLEEGLVGKC